MINILNLWEDSEIISSNSLMEYAENLKYFKHISLSRKGLRSKLHACELSAKPELEKRLLKVEQDFKVLKAQIIERQAILKNQISKIRRLNYQQCLIMRYLYLYKWAKIEFIFFGQQDDFEDEKNYKYKDLVMYWHRRALVELVRTYPEEKTALNAIRKIKKLCKNYKELTPTDFLNRVSALVEYKN